MGKVRVCITAQTGMFRGLLMNHEIELDLDDKLTLGKLILDKETIVLIKSKLAEKGFMEEKIKVVISEGVRQAINQKR